MSETQIGSTFRPDRSDTLGRYYTKRDIGTALVAHMTGLNPSRLLDLGSGSGSLSYAAVSRWKGLRLLTVDIDACASRHLSMLLPKDGRHVHSHIQADALCSNLPTIIPSTFKRIDAGVCNPPFITPTWRKGFSEILEDAGFSSCLPVLPEVNAALLFLAQNLRVLSTQSTLGIILPDTLVSGMKHEQFRRELLRRYCVRKVVRLPRRSFQGTDALAHILILSKGSGTEDKIPLHLFKPTFSDDSIDSISIDVEQGIKRLDFLYHSQNVARYARLPRTIELRQVCTDLSRGVLTAVEVRASRSNALHTTDIACSWAGQWKRFPKSNKTLGGHRKKVEIQAGDILMARVGRNLQQKIVGVKAGGAAITDCLYRIRVPKPWRQHVLSELTSRKGQLWLESRIHGVSARIISKTDLLAFPLRKLASLVPSGKINPKKNNYG